MTGRRRQSSALADLLTLLFWPVGWLARRIFKTHRAGPDTIKRFYRSAEWKRLRFTHLSAHPACRTCGASAKTGAKMNVDHIKPLHRHWHLRLQPHNLQTLCASCNWGKGGRWKTGAAQAQALNCRA